MEALPSWPPAPPPPDLDAIRSDVVRLKEAVLRRVEAQRLLTVRTVGLLLVLFQFSIVPIFGYRDVLLAEAIQTAVLAFGIVLVVWPTGALRLVRGSREAEGGGGMPVALALPLSETIGMIAGSLHTLARVGAWARTTAFLLLGAVLYAWLVLTGLESSLLLAGASALGRAELAGLLFTGELVILVVPAVLFVARRLERLGELKRSLEGFRASLLGLDGLVWQRY